MALSVKRPPLPSPLSSLSFLLAPPSAADDDDRQPEGGRKGKGKLSSFSSCPSLPPKSIDRQQGDRRGRPFVRSLDGRFDGGGGSGGFPSHATGRTATDKREREGGREGSKLGSKKGSGKRRRRSNSSFRSLQKPFSSSSAYVCVCLAKGLDR